MPEAQGTIIAALMEQLIQTGPEGMAQAFTALFNLAMRLERGVRRTGSFTSAR